ncbi:P-loop containing nucleoside triphosphate hydrolase protein [Rhizopus microsporus var. microsporus]|uniref:P-loop containing nucleoside triphosphate hydrolase protein n=1 Tax=Rhizopus microsporus var. microsporus TaxID=86635 RepID=A0A1X0R6L7_RHIZD|nr:P-loop containing nucleoside triphosphate hydrolase protein [Rhizopus microsporus var. microsporus]
MNSSQHSSGRKRKQEYIPKERYDIDGTLIKNEEYSNKKSTWDFREIIRDQRKYYEAMKDAQAFVKAKKNEKEALVLIDHERCWTEEIDDLFFSRRKRGMVSWYMPTGSPIYYEFERFYENLKESVNKDKKPATVKRDPMSIIKQEGEFIRHALVLFHDFTEKKKRILREKIETNRQLLPVTPFANAIVETLRKHRVLLVAGDTGCGKSTQVPQILMKAGFDKIACTQPRRIACSSLARRVSYETLNEYGSQIAYQVRFEGNRTHRTRVLFLTEGLLLRQYTADNMLSMYDVIIVDEVHERHMMGDFLLSLLKKTLAQRKDLYVVLMSATINAELFAQYFDAPTLVVPGKMYSVKMHYWPQGDEDTHLVNEAAHRKRQTDVIKSSIPSRPEPINPAPYIRVMDYIDQSVPAGERGDLLIFMSGINEISILSEALIEYTRESKKWIVLMLHSSLSVEEQEKVFDAAPEGIRKCIISSNIAETSITIDDIRFIIDSGKVKEMNHDPASKMSRLSEFWISKASAKQRAGRAGRTGPGECFRLYSENEYNHFHDFAIPEIQRAPLEPLLLQIKCMDLGDPRHFDYLEANAINASIDFLQNLGALDSNENITGLGAVLAQLPVDAIVGKMLILGMVFNVIDPIVTIAAGMSVQSPFVRITSNRNPEIIKNRSQFDSKHGDSFTLLNVWQAWLDVKNDRKESSRKWCKRHGIEEQRLYEITKMKKQFEKILNDFRPGLLQSLQQESDDYESTQSRHQIKEKLRREKFDQKTNKRRKVLEMNTFDEQEDEPSDKVDIRDLEFALMNDVRQLRSRASSLSKRQVELVKLIICSALYPQFAIGDEHNPHRNSNELVFHTTVKSFLCIHPTSVVASHPEWVQGDDPKRRKDDQTAEDAMQQQLLCYLQLLETNKPYILNITRTPGIHVLLLFAKSIDTNFDCSLLVVDKYYIIRFRTTPVAEYVLYLSSKLRSIWNKLLNLRISQGLGKVVEEESNVIISPATKEKLPLGIQHILSEQGQTVQGFDRVDMWTPETELRYRKEMQSLCDKLVEFMETSISAELSIGKASELIKMYPKYKPDENREDNLPRTWNSRQVIQGGIQISPSLYYDSIDAPSCASPVPIDQIPISEHLKTYWYCDQCKEVYSFNRNEAMDHLSTSKHKY